MQYKTIISISALAATMLMIPGCGSSSAADVPAATATPSLLTNPTPMDDNAVGIKIHRPAYAEDSYEGGLYVLRDASAVVGGKPGFVNTAIYSHSIAGKDQTSFEWSILGVIDNYANSGDQVAGYFQANKHGNGPTFALASEVTDTTGGSGATVSYESDVWIAGPDSGNRVGIDVVVGDALTIRGLGKSPDATASVGLRISPTSTTPWAGWTRGVQLVGRYQVGMDLSTGNYSGSAIRLAEGQPISLEQTDTIQIQYKAGKVILTNAGIPVFTIDATTGETAKRAQ